MAVSEPATHLLQYTFSFVFGGSLQRTQVFTPLKIREEDVSASDILTERRIEIETCHKKSWKLIETHEQESPEIRITLPKIRFPIKKIEWPPLNVRQEELDDSNLFVERIREGEFCNIQLKSRLGFIAMSMKLPSELVMGCVKLNETTDGNGDGERWFKFILPQMETWEITTTNKETKLIFEIKFRAPLILRPPKDFQRTGHMPKNLKFIKKRRERE